jgi:hypothetical protein
MNKFLLGVISALLIATTANAATMYGVEITEKSMLAGQSLTLNGVGLRKKGPFKVYLAALYTGEKSTDAEKILAQTGPKRVELRMLRNVAKKKMVGAIVDGFEDNTKNMASIQARVDEFITYMEEVKKGDNIQFDFLPAIGTNIVINGNIKGSIVGKDFFDALMKVWVGDKPADGKLKNAMLGL